MIGVAFDVIFLRGGAELFLPRHFLLRLGGKQAHPDGKHVIGADDVDDESGDAESDEEDETSESEDEETGEDLEERTSSAAATASWIASGRRDSADDVVANIRARSINRTTDEETGEEAHKPGLLGRLFRRS